MVNLEELRKEIRAMTPRKKLFMVLKEELTKLEHWRNHLRGNPKAGYKVKMSRLT